MNLNKNIKKVWSNFIQTNMFSLWERVFIFILLAERAIVLVPGLGLGLRFFFGCLLFPFVFLNVKMYTKKEDSYNEDLDLIYVGNEDHTFEVTMNVLNSIPIYIKVWTCETLVLIFVIIMFRHWNHRQLLTESENISQTKHHVIKSPEKPGIILKYPENLKSNAINSSDKQIKSQEYTHKESNSWSRPSPITVYKQFRSSFLNNISHQEYNFDVLKEIFKCRITSPRSMEKIKTIKDLISRLEKQQIIFPAKGIMWPYQALGHYLIPPLDKLSLEEKINQILALMVPDSNRLESIKMENKCKLIEHLNINREIIQVKKMKYVGHPHMCEMATNSYV